jgi:hypothetical protein
MRRTDGTLAPDIGRRLWAMLMDPGHMRFPATVQLDVLGLMTGLVIGSDGRGLPAAP